MKPWSQAVALSNFVAILAFSLDGGAQAISDREQGRVVLTKTNYETKIEQNDFLIRCGGAKAFPQFQSALLEVENQKTNGQYLIHLSFSADSEPTVHIEKKR